MSTERERTILRAGTTGPGVLARTSVSQVGTFDPSQDGGCPTKWWMEKIDGRWQVSTKAQTGGTEDHAQIEHYLNTGEDVLGPRTRVGKYLIPAPGSDLLVEHEFKGTDLVAAGVPFLGYIDCVNPRGEYLDAEGELKRDPPDTIEVIDWKTTSDFKWAKAGSALVRTVQMPAYGQYVSTSPLVALGNGNGDRFDFVRLSHVYFRTKGAPAAEKRTALVPLTTIRSRWEQISGVVREMKDVALESDVRKVPKNLNACTAYGGCPHANYCPRNKLDLLKTVLHAVHEPVVTEPVTPEVSQGARPMGILDRLKAEAAAKTTPPPTLPDASTIAPKALATAMVAAGQAVVAAPKAASKLDAIAKMKADLAEAERLAALEMTDPEGGGTPNDDDAPPVVLAKDAIVNAHYEGRMEDGSTFKVQFIGHTKAGWTFRRLDKSGTMNLEEDTGLVYVSGPALAPIPTGVLPHDVPKPGQSGPTFVPFAEGESAPTNVLAEQARLQAATAPWVKADHLTKPGEYEIQLRADGDYRVREDGDDKKISEKVSAAYVRAEFIVRTVKPLPEVVTGIPAQAPPVAEKGTRLRRTQAEMDAGMTVEQAREARAKAAASAPAPAAPVELVKVKPAPVAPPVVEALKPAPITAEAPVAEDRPAGRVSPEVFAEATKALAAGAVEFFAPARGITLYLDIVPVKGGENVKSLQPFLDDVCDALGKAHGVGDIRYATGNNDLAFGKWKGALAEALKESVIDPGSWSLVGIRESEIRQVAAEAFSSKATTVFRSVG